MTEGRLIKRRSCTCDAKPVFWHTELNEPSSQDASILQRPAGLKLKSICLVTKVFVHKPSLTLERMPGIWQMLVSSLMAVYIPVASTMEAKTHVGLNEGAHECRIVMFKATHQ